MIKILMGGSPCTFWSIAQKNNRETEAEGLGWELFKNYLIAKEKFKPDLFLYENNKSAAQPIKDQISRELGVDLMYINSALVSAQNRQRFYAFNWQVDQPEDRGILLRDILESGSDLTDNDKSFCLTASYNGAVAWNTLERSQRTMVVEPVGIGWRGRQEGGKWKKRYESNGEPKANALTTAQTDSMVAEPIRVGGMPRPNGELSTSQAKRVYSIEGKSVNLTANGGGEGAKTGLYAVPYEFIDYEPRRNSDIVINDNSIRCVLRDAKKSSTQETVVKFPDSKTNAFVTAHTPKVIDKAEYYNTDNAKVYKVENGFIEVRGKQYPIKLADGFYIIRKLTPVECERLQTLPDGYTRNVSNAQRYKGLGNGWTAEVIIHILNGALKDVPRDEEIVVLSMYDGIGTGRYCLDAMGFTNVKYFAYEIDKYAKQISMSNYPDIIQCGDAFDIRHPDWTIGY
ncbi:MAG: DNA cytosine methyltransferase [Clostridia bacterium]|nr:DNA cytosine methyltransferase [Clostridia bacterium]